MKLRAHADIPAEPLAVGNTLPDMVPFLGVPFWHVPAIMTVSGIVVMVTRNPFWFACVLVGLIFAVRHLLALNFNRPRELWLSFLSGSMFADRTVFGGESADVHLPHGRSVGPL